MRLLLFLVCSLWMGLLAGYDNTVVVAPRIRDLPEATIDHHAFSHLRPFFKQASVILKKTKDQAALIHLDEDTVNASVGHIIYANKILPIGRRYRIVRADESIVHPKTQAILGYIAVDTGIAEVLDNQDHSLKIIKAHREILAGDLLLEERTFKEFKETFYEAQPQSGMVVGIQDGFSMAAPYQSVVIDLGTEHGIKPGMRLTTFPKEKFKLSGTAQNGVLLVYDTAPTVSLCLIMQAKTPIYIEDPVIIPAILE